MSQNFVSNSVQNQIPIVNGIPNSLTQIIISKLLCEFGVSMKIVTVILLFL